MDTDEWLRLLVAAIGGGLTVKLLDIGYQELRRRSESSEAARKFVDVHLDPLLKSADELVGKLVSLAGEDFRSLRDVEAKPDSTENNDFAGLIFLTAKFWANMEIIRREGLSVSIVKDLRGRQLQRFMDCLESRGVRIVDRVSQRAVGELMLTDRRDGPLQTILFVEFVRSMEGRPDARRWISPLAHTFSRTRHTSDRQRLLRYGIVIHALIDSLDPEHQVTRDRPSYPNKLSKRSWRDLKYRVFGRYLKFVPDPEKYFGPPKRGRPRVG